MAILGPGPSREILLRGAVAALSLLLLAAAPPPPGMRQDQAQELPEYVVKAGFLFNFAKYVEWPADAFERPDSPLRVGIAGEDPFGDTLEKTFQNKTVNNRAFVIERFREPSDIKPCHILFVARTEKARVGDILDRVRKRSTLTVGEDASFARTEGVINVLIEDRKPKLEINADSAAEQKVTINSKLLKLATIVRTEK